MYGAPDSSLMCHRKTAKGGKIGSDNDDEMAIFLLKKKNQGKTNLIIFFRQTNPLQKC